VNGSVKKSSAASNRYHLTVAKDKLAVLLRLPKKAIKIIDGMAKSRGSKRTSVIYDIIGAHPDLTESMQAVCGASGAGGADSANNSDTGAA
jgi:hypothetical protein